MRRHRRPLRCWGDARGRTAFHQSPPEATGRTLGVDPRMAHVEQDEGASAEERKEQCGGPACGGDPSVPEQYLEFLEIALAVTDEVEHIRHPRQGWGQFLQVHRQRLAGEGGPFR